MRHILFAVTPGIDVAALRTQLGVVSPALHQQFVKGNSEGRITGQAAVVSAFLASHGILRYGVITAAMEERAREALRQVGAAHLADRHLDQMSSGEARRVMLARVLAPSPRALVLDEPTTGLDLAARHAFMERVRDIARALDIQGASLYAHVASKQDVLWSIVDRTASQFEAAADLMRQYHPLRVSRWAISDMNPWLWWLAPAANAAAANRQPLGADAPLRQAENSFAQMISASLDFWRSYRDAMSKSTFFQLYGNPLAIQLVQGAAAAQPKGRRWRDANAADLPLVRQILERIAEGGYAEAVGRLAALLHTKGEPIPLARIEAHPDVAPVLARNWPAS